MVRSPGAVGGLQHFVWEGGGGLTSHAGATLVGRLGVSGRGERLPPQPEAVHSPALKRHARAHALRLSTSPVPSSNTHAHIVHAQNTLHPHPRPRPQVPRPLAAGDSHRDHALPARRAGGEAQPAGGPDGARLGAGEGGGEGREGREHYFGGSTCWKLELELKPGDGRRRR
mgnify:CR=1 FL=1